MPNYKLERGSIQFGFNQSRHKIQVFGGAFANGKTTALVIKALQLAKDYPGSNGLLARETYPKLNDTLRKVFFYWCPPSWIKKKPTQDDNTCYLHNGSVINFRYISQRGKSQADGTTSSNLLSATYDYIGVDQIEDPGITHKDLLDLMGRLRGQTAYRPEDGNDPSMPDSGPRWLMLTANPSPNWFYKEVVLPYLNYIKYGIISEKLLIDPDTKIPIIELFEGSTYTNKSNLTEDYIKGLEATYKGQMRDRYLLGKWASYEGLVYSEWDRSINMITRDEALDHLVNCLKHHVQVRVVEGYDFGLTSPSCYLFGFVDDWGRLFILDGYYKSNFHYTLQPLEIMKIRAKYSAYGLKIEESIQADPSIFKRIVVAGIHNTGDTIAKLYKEDGIDMRPASNDITQGIAKVAGYIAGTFNTPDFRTGETPGSLLYVVDDLEFIDSEITGYYWKKNTRGDNIDEPQDSNDHSMDTLKYMLSHLPSPSKIIIPDSVKIPKWMFWHEVENEE